MKISKMPLFCFLIFLCCAGLNAQDNTNDIVSALKGLLYCMNTMDDMGYAGGENADSSLKWKVELNTRKGKVIFTEFSFYTVTDQLKANDIIVFNGTLDVNDQIFNGTLKVSGKNKSVSSMTFYDFDFWDDENEGKVSVNGKNFPAEEFRDLLYQADGDYDGVFTWETEGLYACLYLLMLKHDFEWSNGANVLNSIVDTDIMPEAGTKTANEDGTITAVVREKGIEFTYNNLSLNPEENNPLGIAFSATGKVVMGCEYDLENDIDSIFFDGDIVFVGLKLISSMSFKNCVIDDTDDEDETLKGFIVVNGREYAFRDFLSIIMKI